MEEEMENRDNKTLVHFNTDTIKIYDLKNGILKMLNEERVSFGTGCLSEVLEKIKEFLKNLSNYTNKINKKSIRLYKTSLFKNFKQEKKNQIVNNIFVDYALYFNVVPFDLEQFYLQNSRNICESENMIQGLLCQEFRNVVVCGSFQQFLQDIEKLIKHLYRYNINVLSPASTKIKPETIGTEFILFDYQDCIKNERDTWRHKYEHMEKFRQADAIIVCDPRGVVGKGTIFEFGFMTAISKRIIFMEQPKNISIFFPYEIGLNF